MDAGDPLLFQDQYRIRSTRLNGWDYGDAGMYFVTICTKHKIPWFGEIQNGYVGLSNIGSIIHQCWAEIPVHFPHVTLDQYIVMPDHFHAIVMIHERAHDVVVQTPYMASLQKPNPYHRPEWKPGSLGVIIQQFKRACTARIRITHPNFSWQPRFHNRVIRNRDETIRIRKYIINNPSAWTAKHPSSD